MKMKKSFKIILIFIMIYLVIIIPNVVKADVQEKNWTDFSNAEYEICYR